MSYAQRRRVWRDHKYIAETCIFVVAEKLLNVFFFCWCPCEVVTLWLKLFYGCKASQHPLLFAEIDEHFCRNVSTANVRLKPCSWNPKLLTPFRHDVNHRCQLCRVPGYPQNLNEGVAPLHDSTWQHTHARGHTSHPSRMFWDSMLGFLSENTVKKSSHPRFSNWPLLNCFYSSPNEVCEKGGGGEKCLTTDILVLGKLTITRRFSFSCFFSTLLKKLH